MEESHCHLSWALELTDLYDRPQWPPSAAGIDDHHVAGPALLSNLHGDTLVIGISQYPQNSGIELIVLKVDAASMLMGFYGHMLPV